MMEQILPLFAMSLFSLDSKYEKKFLDSAH